MADSGQAARSSEERAQDYAKWYEEEVDTSKIPIPPPDTILGECPQFRILLLGRSGVGKSTVCMLVFGLSELEAGVSHSGSGIHNVEIPKTNISNQRIIIHDSGGFEGGESQNFQKALEFIKRKKHEKELAQQLHCIWYCISCKQDSRMVQKYDREFFRNRRNIAGPIPVIAVFTQYDKLVKEVRDDYVGRNWDRIIAGEISGITQIHDIQQLIKHKFEIMEREWEKIISPIGIGRVYLSNPPSDILSSNPGLIVLCGDVGVEKLTRMTMQQLEDHGGLRPLWAAAQNNLTDYKLEQSVLAGMASFSMHLGINAIPILPGLSAASFWYAFSKACSNISPLWTLRDDEKLLNNESVRRKLLGAILNTNPVGFLVLQGIDILGFTDATATASVFAKAIAGITLILDDLFVLQLESRHDGKPIESLTEIQIDKSAEEFRLGKLRSTMIGLIDGSQLFNKAYSKSLMSNLILDVVEIARASNLRLALSNWKRSR